MRSPEADGVTTSPTLSNPVMRAVVPPGVAVVLGVGVAVIVGAVAVGTGVTVALPDVGAENE